MRPELIEAHPRVDAVRDCAAIQRGPLIYCLEAADQPHVNMLDVRVEPSTPLRAVWRDDLAPDGMMTIQFSGCIPATDDWQGRLYRRLDTPGSKASHSLPLTAVPYFAWANRGANAMRVWIPRCAPAIDAEG